MKFTTNQFRNPEFLKRRTEIYNQKKESDDAAQRGYLFKEKLPLFKPKSNSENVISVNPFKLG